MKLNYFSSLPGKNDLLLLEVIQGQAFALANGLLTECVTCQNTNIKEFYMIAGLS